MQPDQPVVGGVALRRPAITSPNYVAGSTGWTINADGSAEFNNVTIRGGLVESGTNLYYNGTPAAGNLIASISATAGTDPFGNTYRAGIVVYNNTTGGYAILQAQTTGSDTVLQIVAGDGSELHLDIGSGAAVTFYPKTGAPTMSVGSLQYSQVTTAPDWQPLLSVTSPAVASSASAAILQLVGSGVNTLTSSAFLIADRIVMEPNVAAALNMIVQGTLNYGTGGVAETWHTATLLNNFTQGTPNLRYRLLASPPNSVHLTGLINSGVTVASGTTIATLPSGYRPASTVAVAPVANVSTGAALWLGLDTSGNLALHGTWANTNSIVINGIYPLD